jgi:prepilin-type N-terminal cleavage/methylation domain-containing protein
MRRLFARAKRSRRDERGFTLTEVVVVVVVMAIVITPISIAVTQSMKLTPDASARTKVAVDTSLLVDRFTADIANSSLNGGVLTGATPNVFSNLDIYCGDTSALTFYWPENSWLVLTTDTTLKSTAPTLVAYTADWTTVSGGKKFVLSRSYVVPGGGYIGKRAMLSGFCTTGQKVATLTNEAKGTNNGATRRVSMTVWVRRAIDSAQTKIVLTGSVRDTGV